MTGVIDWSRPIIFRDGAEARLMARDAAQERTSDTRRRVMRGDTVHEERPTIVMVDENGSCNRGGAESPWDIVQLGGSEA